MQLPDITWNDQEFKACLTKIIASYIDTNFPANDKH